MRVYLPATLPALRSLLSDCALPELGVSAYAVTPALREWYAEGDSEELEYVALTAAARESLRLLDPLLVVTPDAPARRVVVAADVPDTCVQVGGHPELDRASVAVSAPVTLAQVQAVHVDDPQADAAVRLAAESLVAAGLGSDAAEFAVAEADGHELLWYATQEIGPLLELL